MTKWDYGVVIDAGSSGSRIHIYRWLKNGRALQDADAGERAALPVVKSKKKWTKKIKPGISTFGKKPRRVGPDHLEALFEHARDHIPKDSHASTPIFLLATAGMRLLPAAEQHQLLDQICSYAKSHTNFLITECQTHFQIIPGETEGLYGWIAANYLLGGYDQPHQHDHGKGHHTYGFLDMGGASAQIAFAPNATEAERHSNDLQLVRLRSVDGSAREYRIFVTTWLEFGVREARKRYIERLLKDKAGHAQGLSDPCLPEGLQISTEGDVLTPDQIQGKKVHLVGTGDFAQCMKITTPLLNKDAPCHDAPCLLNGQHVPAIDFDVNHFVGVSEYWHTTHEIFEFGHQDKAYDFHTYQQRVSEFCSRPWHEIQTGVEHHNWGEKVTESTAVEICFKASWLINVLHDGIGIPRVGLEDVHHGYQNTTKKVLDGAKDKGFTDPFQAVNKIDDTEVSWTLGKAVLFASSEVPPAGSPALPVGFGPNDPALATNFSLAGLHRPSSSTNATADNDGDSWHHSLFDEDGPRRIPGLLLFAFIICIAAFLLCGKERRGRFLRRCILCCPILLPSFLGGPGHRRRRGGGSGGGSGSLFFSKSTAMSQPSGAAADRLLESGGLLNDPDDFEMGSFDGDGDGAYSDDSAGPSRITRQMTGRSSGWATPTSRLSASIPAEVARSAHAGFSNNSNAAHNVHSGFDHAAIAPASGSGSGSGSVGLGLVGRSSFIGNAMDRSGLSVRTESRERLNAMSGAGAGSLGPGSGRSRRGSPVRKSPLTTAA